MALFKKDTINTEKELELVATIYDFITEATDEEMGATSYGEAEAKKSINKKAKTLEDLLKFDLDGYSGCVDKKLLSSVRDVRNALRDELHAWIQEDKLTLAGDFDAYRVEQLIADARSAQYRLKSGIGAFKLEFAKFTDRYKKDHDGNDPDKEIEEYSIRHNL